MTREERNIKLKAFITCLKCGQSGKCCDDNCPTQYEAGNMAEIIENLEAISKALEQEPTTKNDSSELEKNSKKLEKDFGELDCIDRAELLKAMDTWDKFGYSARYGLERLDKDDKGYVPYVHYEDIVNCIKNLPSVTPQLSIPEVTALAEWTEKLTKECEDAYNKGYEAGRKELEPITSKDKFIYALTACGCLLKDGKTWYEHNELIKCFEDLGLFEQEPTIKALGEELRKARKGIADEKVLIGYNMAVAICNKHLGESEG